MSLEARNVDESGMRKVGVWIISKSTQDERISRLVYSNTSTPLDETMKI